MGALVVCGTVTAMWTINPGLSANPAASVSRLVYGTAERPYVTRALVPLVIRGVAALVPDSGKAALNRRVETTDKLRHRFEQWNFEKEYSSEYLIAFLLNWALLFGFVIALRAMIDTVVAPAPGVAGLAALLSVVALPVTFRYTSFVYDFATLFLSTLLLLLLARKRFGAYLAVFAFAAANRETALLFTMASFLVLRRDPAVDRRRLLVFLGVQVMLWLAIRGTIALVFADNPGESFPWQLRHNLDLLRPWSLGGVAFFSLLAFAVFHRWREKPPFLRAALTILPAQVALAIFFGYLEEYRIYYESLPIVVSLLIRCQARN